MSITETSGAVLFAPINQSLAASSTIVAADTARKIRVLGVVLSNNDGSNPVVVTLQGKREETPKKLIGPIRLAAGQTVVIPASGLGYGETDVGQALDLLLGSAITVGGSITYQLVR